MSLLMFASDQGGVLRSSGDNRPEQSSVTRLPLGCTGSHGSALAGRRSLQKCLEQIVAVTHTEFVVDQNDAVLDNLAGCPKLSRDVEYYATLLAKPQPSMYL